VVIGGSSRVFVTGPGSVVDRHFMIVSMAV